MADHHQGDQQVDFDLCRICGDFASGYNFNVLTCESCRAFFRRNASKLDTLCCRFHGDCEITKTKRSFCRYCRLKKCFHLGMRKDSRLTYAIDKWQGGGGVAQIVPDNDDLAQVDSLPANDTIYSISRMYGTIDELLVINDQNPGHTSLECNTVSTSSTDFIIDCNDDGKYGYPVHRTSSPPLEEQLEELIIKEPDYSIVPVHRPITDYRNNFTESEGRYLTELLVATDSLKTPIGTITSEAMTFNDAIQVLHCARWIDSKGLVTIPRGLSAFKGITHEDRLVMIEQGVIKMHHLRNVACYFKDDHSQYVIVPTVGDQLSTCLVPLDVLRQTKPYLYSAHIDYFESLAAEWDSDYVILIMLSAIVLFNPNEKNDIQAISEKQMIYKNLLKRYLLLRYRSEEKANEKFGRLMKSIDLVNVLNDKRKQNALEENYYSDDYRSDLFTQIIAQFISDM